MKKVKLALLRGICQTPAYVAADMGFLKQEGLDAQISISPTAWLIPDQLAAGSVDFAVLPWTRVAAAEKGEAPLKIICGSGCEEAVIVLRNGLQPKDVRVIAVPREGGMKDLTAMALVRSLGWSECEQRRFPSGDGAIIAFVGEGADAASMVEPYAAMMERLGIGRAIRRTGDIWPGAPGCSLAASAALLERDPDLAQGMVNAYVRAASFVLENPREAAAIAAPYIGLHADTIHRALQVNRPDVNAIRNTDTMNTILGFMRELGYIDVIPHGFADLSFLNSAQDAAVASSRHV